MVVKDSTVGERGHVGEDVGWSAGAVDFHQPMNVRGGFCDCGHILLDFRSKNNSFLFIIGVLFQSALRHLLVETSRHIAFVGGVEGGFNCEMFTENARLVLFFFQLFALLIVFHDS